jgi:hypothetical protein
MKQKLLTLLAFCLLSSAFAQGLARKYEYDNAGNRIIRKVITLVPKSASPVPTDSTFVTPDDYELLSSKSLHSPNIETTTDDFFVEKIAQTEIKIYPNPTTEKVTLEITNMETLQTGIFRLYSMSGQLLQESPVYASVTEVYLAGLARGNYILKVQINDRIEDWKIIKN